VTADAPLTGRRIWALTIDLAIGLAAALAIAIAAGEIAGLAAALVAPTLVMSTFLGVAGTTPGKRALDLAVVDEQGRPVFGRRALHRELWGRFVLEHGLLFAGGAGAIGYLAGLRGDRRAWHDRVAGTRVIRRGGLLPDAGLLPRRVGLAAHAGPGGLELAPFLPRASAFLIDTALVTSVWAVLFVPVAIFTGQVDLNDAEEVAISDGFAFATFAAVPLLAAAYAIVALHRYETTVGKHAVGLSVRRADGTRLGLRRAVMRELVGRQIAIGVAGGLFSAGLAGALDLLFPLWQKNRQSLHDMIGDSVVVRAPGRRRSALDSAPPAADTDS
jgi:uncharacterized RDD family membrane protein YckC